MRHKNTQFTGHTCDMETDQQNRSELPPELPPEPCIFYQNFPHPNMQSVIPMPHAQSNFNYPRLPERHESGLLFGMPQMNIIQPQHPFPNLDLTVAAPSAHYTQYMAPASCVGDFPVPVTHGALDACGIASIPINSHCRSLPHMDDMRGSFKRKNADGIHGNHQYHNASSGSSSSAVPVNATASESNFTLMDTVSLLPRDYGSNEPISMMEGGSHGGLRNWPGMIGPESVLAYNTSHMRLANYSGPPIQMPGSHWLEMCYGSNNADVGSYGWAPAPLPYVHAREYGACVEAGNVGSQRFQVSSSGRTPGGFLHPPLRLGHPSPLQPPPNAQGARGYNICLPSQMSLSSRQISATGSPDANCMQDGGTTFLPPSPPTGFRLYRPPGREIILDSISRLHAFPQLRLLPEDEISVLEIPGYHEARDSIDQHRDMRLDIDHMSYEELLALGEQIGSVGTGVPEEFIRNNLKARTFTSSATGINLDEPCYADQQIDFCVICQSNYEENEDIGTVDCGHEYHKECLKRWLLIKNTCPICKSTALGSRARSG